MLITLRGRLVSQGRIDFCARFHQFDVVVLRIGPRDLTVAIGIWLEIMSLTSRAFVSFASLNALNGR
jgi:hypothetical protein